MVFSNQEDLQMKKRLSEEQIVGILREAERAGSIREVCRKNNISEQTFFRWRNKYGGMEVPDANSKALKPKTPSSRSRSLSNC